jgi:MYXO-CTERM domain-containing protein
MLPIMRSFPCNRSLRTVTAVLAGNAALLAAGSALAETYYVSPTGNDAANGSEGAPFRTPARAQQAAAAGDTVLFRGGEYVFAGNDGPANAVLFNKSGTQGARINYWAYPGEQPVFDFFNYTPAQRIKGFSVTGSFLHFRGLELRGVRQTLQNVNESWCIRNEGNASNNIYEQLDLHDNQGPGLFIAAGGNNLVINVDSHHNFDPENGGGNSDGFGCHSTQAGNVFRGARAWWNSDDGFDFINAPGVCTVEGSWAFYNGFLPDTFTPSGNGAGIKAGGFTNNVPNQIPRHVVRFNLSFGNARQGFYANHHEGGLDFINNTAFDNRQRNFDMLADEGPAPHFLRNNLAFGTGGNISQVNAGEVDDRFSTWNLGVNVSAADFLSTDETGADGPRQADGRLPILPFLRLAPGSDLIDAGQDVGLPFADRAPDLGAFESGLPIIEPPGIEPPEDADPMEPEPDDGDDAPDGTDDGDGSGDAPAQGPTFDVDPVGDDSSSMMPTGSGDVPAVEPVDGEPTLPEPGGDEPSAGVDPTGGMLSADPGADGCGCRLGDSPMSSHRSWPWLGALLALGALRRRRSGRRS